MSDTSARLRTLALLGLVSLAAGTNDFGKKFLAENAEKEGVVVLPSGLQYKVLRKGTGDSHPTASSPCKVHYEGRVAQKYPDGEKFDSSYDRGSPTTFAPNQVIKGWTEAMQLMVEGDKWEMFIPSELGYGDRGSPPRIGGGDVLVFTMEILKITGDKVPASKCDPATLAECSDAERAFVEKMRAKGKEAMAAEISRLEGLQTAKVAPEKIGWMKARVRLLRQMTEAKDEL